MKQKYVRNLAVADFFYAYSKPLCTWPDGSLHVMLAIYCSGGDLCRQRLHLIQCPTFILHGGKDPLVPTFHADVLKEGIAYSRLHMFPDGKHNIHTAFAQEFNHLVLGFLRS